MIQAWASRRCRLRRFLGRSEFANDGLRVVEGQRLMQAASDILLGWLHADEGRDAQSRDFHIRELWDVKDSVMIRAMEPTAIEAYAEICGWSLARARARSGDAVAIGSYLGLSELFERALATFAEAYADQNVCDYEALKQAAASGRVDAEMGL